MSSFVSVSRPMRRGTEPKLHVVGLFPFSRSNPRLERDFRSLFDPGPTGFAFSFRKGPRLPSPPHQKGRVVRTWFRGDSNSGFQMSTRNRPFHGPLGVKV